LSIDTNGLLYVGLFESNSIEVYQDHGKLERKWECWKPWALTISDNKVFISSGSKICQFTLEGQLFKEWGSIYDPGEIVVEDNEIFITDFSKHEVLVFSKEGRYLGKWGTKGLSPGQLCNPSGMALSEDLVYVLDKGNTRVQVFTRNGNYLFQLNVPESSTLSRILILNDRAYITDRRTNKIYMFALE